MTSSTPPTGSAATAPARRPGTWRNLVLSMALVFLVVAAWFALMPRSAPIERAEVDVVAKAREVAAQVDWTVQVIAGVPGWRATSASWDRSPEGLPSWQAGYHRRPDDQVYVLVGQTRPDNTDPDAHEGGTAALASWVARQARDGTTVGEQRVGGATWQRIVSGGEPVRRSLVLRGADSSGPTTVLTGNLSFEELGQLAGALQVVPARSGTTG